MDSKACTKCGEVKPLDAYYRQKATKDGRAYWCKGCQREYTRKWTKRPEVRERKREQRQRWEAAHPEYRRAYNRTEEYRAKSRAKSKRDYPKRKEAIVAWAVANPERVKANKRRYYKRNRGEVIRRAAQWERDNPERAAVNRAKKRYRLDATAKEYWLILAADPCSYCGAEVEHRDHIQPKSSGGDSSWSNLTGACASCNTRKQAQPLLHFLMT